MAGHYDDARDGRWLGQVLGVAELHPRPVAVRLLDRAILGILEQPLGEREVLLFVRVALGVRVHSGPASVGVDLVAERRQLVLGDVSTLDPRLRKCAILVDRPPRLRGASARASRPGVTVDRVLGDATDGPGHDGVLGVLPVASPMVSRGSSAQSRSGELEWRGPRAWLAKACSSLATWI